MKKATMNNMNNEIRKISRGEDPVATVREWVQESAKTGKRIKAFWQSSAISYLGVAGGGEEMKNGPYPGAVEYVGVSEGMSWSILFFFDTPPSTTEAPLPLDPAAIEAEIESVYNRIDRECWMEYDRLGGWYDNLEYHMEALEDRILTLRDALEAYQEHMEAAKAIWPKQYVVARWSLPAHVLAMLYANSRWLPTEIIMGSGTRQTRCRGFDWDILIVSEEG